MTNIFDSVVADRAGASLSEVSGDGELMRRYDHKYVASSTRAVEFIASLPEEWKVLDVRGRRSLRYRTTYFDDIQRTCLKDHIRGRRHRFKVRVRTYEDGNMFLETKFKTARGQTDKIRRQRTTADLATFDSAEIEWLDSVLNGFDVRTLRPALSVDYERVTLHSCETSERITIDHSIVVAKEARWFPLLENGAVIETKSSSYNSTMAESLSDHEIRPISFSKYCAGLSVVDEGVHPRVRRPAERLVSAARSYGNV